MKTIQVFENCKSCEYHKHSFSACKECDGFKYFSELYDADPECKHEVVSASGGGIKCTKCRGWFCY